MDRCIGRGHKVKARGSALNGPVNDVDNFCKADGVKEFGDFVLMPCARCEVWISRPEVLDGSTPSVGAQRRRTIPPWFVGVSFDGTSVDNAAFDQCTHIHS